VRRLGPLSVELDPVTPWPRVVVVSGLAFATAIGLVGVLFAILGVSPLRTYTVMFAGVLGDARSSAEILRQAIPLMLIGVGLVMAFRAQFWNIGAEGQLLAGAAGAAAVALFIPVPDAAVVPAMFLAGAVCGAAWGLVPAILRFTMDVNEVITTLMMNYVALFSIEWLVHGPWKGQTAFGFAYTDTFRNAATLATIPATRIHWITLVLGMAFALALGWALARTRLGYEVRVLGESPAAARYAGMQPFRTTVIVMLISGGLAGLAGVGEVAGIHHKLLAPEQVSLGYGYAAIIVAWLARGNPVAAIVTALLLGFIYTAGDAMKVALQVPARVTDVVNGLILLFLIGAERLLAFRVRWTPRGAAAADVPETAP
jgi:general nucleoside transport system permease protein